MLKELFEMLDEENAYSESLRQCQICGAWVERNDMLWTHDCHGISYRHVCYACYEQAMEKGYDGEYYSEADECLDYDY